MDFTGEQYFRAAIDRMRQARQIHDAGNGYALAMYCSGLAVECMLRAFRWQEDPSFEGRHDLRDLFRASRLLRVDEERARSRGAADEEITRTAMELRAAISEIAILWHNNLRFASESSLKAHLKHIDRLQGIRGDALKKNSLDLLDASKVIFDRGVALWTSRRR